MDKRCRKFAAKLSGKERGKLYDAQKESMVEKEAAATFALEKIERDIKKIVQGQPTILIPYYIIFGKEIYKRQNKFKSQTLINEIEILEEKWRTRGLNPDLLDTIKKFYVEIYELGATFHLDISLLDGPHVLG